MKNFFSLAGSLIAISLLVSCGGGDDAPEPVLAITSFSPTSASVGSEVVLTGTGFSTTLSDNVIRFGTIQATVLTATKTSLTVRVPNGSTKAKLTITVEGSLPIETQNEFTTTTFIDERDQQEYSQVKVGDRVWMAENLNFDTASDDYCYSNQTTKCDQYGKLYRWSSARVACPAGWSLPSESDFNTLVATLGGGATAKAALIGPASSSGMNIIYSGARELNGTYAGENSYTFFFSSTEQSADNAIAMAQYDFQTEPWITPAVKNFGFCVRCIKN
jgi:uncharacterized protein (TIGR02145 family)